MAIVVSDLAYAHPGGVLLFSDVSFRVGDREHAGLVGTNGVGKSTLLRILAGDLDPIAGVTQVDRGTQFMHQQVGRVRGDSTVRELLLSVATGVIRTRGTELIRAERAAAEDTSSAAGLALADAVTHWAEVGGYQQEATWDQCTAAVLRQSYWDAAERPVRELSGGEQKRLVLEMLFMSDADVLLLDEPDNFLDLAGKRWLERKLNESSKTILMVSHDRQLLASATNRIVTLEGLGAWVHGGSFAGYEEARTARQERLGDALKRWQEEERRLFQHYKWMKQRASLNADTAGAANAAETRWRKFVDAGPPAAPVRRQRLNMRLSGSESGRKVVVCRRLAIPGLVDTLELEVRYGERVAVVGGNGTGKSHFVRLVAGEPVAHEGEAVLGARVVAGLFSQTHEHPEWTGRQVVDIVRGAGLAEQAAMTGLARYGLQGTAWQAFETLSGGQQARLQVLLLELEGANLLLLDEPTDNLDLESAEALEAALEDFAGTVIAVTHDRWLMRSFERFLLFDYDGSVRESAELEELLPALAGEQSIADTPRLKLMTKSAQTPRTVTPL